MFLSVRQVTISLIQTLSSHITFIDFIWRKLKIFLRALKIMVRNLKLRHK